MGHCRRRQNAADHTAGPAGAGPGSLLTLLPWLPHLELRLPAISFTVWEFLIGKGGHCPRVPYREGWVLGWWWLVRLSHLFIRWGGSPDIERKYSYWAAPQSDRWLVIQCILPFESCCQIALQKDCTSLYSTKRIWECLSLINSPTLDILASLVGERWGKETLKLRPVW